VTLGFEDEATNGGGGRGGGGGGGGNNSWSRGGGSRSSPDWKRGSRGGGGGKSGGGGGDGNGGGWTPRENVVFMHGVTADGHTACVMFRGHRTYFYLSMPEGCAEPWIENLQERLGREVDEYGPLPFNGLESVELVHRKPIVGFCGDRLMPFAMFRFRTTFAQFRFRRALERLYPEPDEERDVRRWQADPWRPEHEREWRRYNEVMVCEGHDKDEMHFQDAIKATCGGWVALQPNEYCRPNDPFSSAHHSWVCTSVTPIPDRDHIAPCLVLSLDIECVRPQADDAVPDPDDDSNGCIMVGNTFFASDHASAPVRLVYSVGECDLAAANLDRKSISFPPEHIFGQRFAAEGVLRGVWRAWLCQQSLPFTDPTAPFAEPPRALLAARYRSEAELQRAWAAWVRSLSPAPNRKQLDNLAHRPDIIFGRAFANRDELLLAWRTWVRDCVTATPGSAKIGSAPDAPTAAPSEQLLGGAAADAFPFEFFGRVRLGEGEPFRDAVDEWQAWEAYCDSVGLRGVPTEPLEVKVVHFETEGAMLTAWARLLRASSPDVVLGHNILGFDLSYLMKRIRRIVGVPVDCRVWGRLDGRESKVKESELESNAIAYNKTLLVPAPGVVFVDSLIMYQRDITVKLKNYDLDTVSRHFLKVGKTDMHYSEIYRYWSGTARQRGVLARYNATDCELPYRLFQKSAHWPKCINTARINRILPNYICVNGAGLRFYGGLHYQVTNDKMRARTP
ncbi:DNA polymerase family B, partial [uncultured virus]